MSCTDYERHELACPHHAGTRVAWRATDGCSGSFCTDCWQTYQVSRWPDLTKQAVGPAEGLEVLALLRVLAAGAETQPWSWWPCPRCGAAELSRDRAGTPDRLVCMACGGQATVEAAAPARFAVGLSCGHRWVETRPPGMAYPVQGELRACGAPEHYPMRYPANYAPAYGSGPVARSPASPGPTVE